MIKRTQYKTPPLQYRSDSERIRGTQAYRIIRLFGGVPELGDCLRAVGHKITNLEIFRWDHKAENSGTGGYIPHQAMPFVISAARLYGIILTAQLLDPRPCTVDVNVQKDRDLERDEDGVLRSGDNDTQHQLLESWREGRNS